MKLLPILILFVLGCKSSEEIVWEKSKCEQSSSGVESNKDIQIPKTQIYGHVVAVKGAIFLINLGESFCLKVVGID